MKKPMRAEMWEIRKELRRCKSGKPVYDKKGALTAKNGRFRKDHVDLRIYPCNLGCGGWHLTKENVKTELINKKRKRA